jgi:NAD(P)-dependent dehydrogenase (short-subunit alcohol dehydrogenase family)
MDMASVLITGANRGLGLEFARQYSAPHWRVFACCRKPADAAELQAIAGKSDGRTTLHALDVADHGQLDALAKELRNEPIDLLINNAGVYEPHNTQLGKIDFAAWTDLLAVNLLAPTRIVECFIDNVTRSKRKQIVCLSSQMGSIAGNLSGGHYLYRSSKAALNMVVKSMAIDLRERGVTAVALDPGWARTDMGGPDGDLAPAESVRGLIQVLEELKIEDSGKFISYDGAELPW